jgi:hypothetical protein
MYAKSLRMSFLLNSQRRFEDASQQFQMSTTAQAQALQEELQSWYFGNAETFNAGSSLSSSMGTCERPGVEALEAAAAAVKATAATGPPAMLRNTGAGNESSYTVERTAFNPGRGASGGCRGVAAAIAAR